MRTYLCMENGTCFYYSSTNKVKVDMEKMNKRLYACFITICMLVNPNENKSSYLLWGIKSKIPKSESTTNYGMDSSL